MSRELTESLRCDARRGLGNWKPAMPTQPYRCPRCGMGFYSIEAARACCIDPQATASDVQGDVKRYFAQGRTLYECSQIMLNPMVELQPAYAIFEDAKRRELGGSMEALEEWRAARRRETGLSKSYHHGGWSK